ncbi:VWA domain-containing protein [Paenibacillus sp. WQ 127069]|uniref:VWA domain-containing protein n=1 Tax=Paenibacillus baimaensis TaxID=2982185 RepID=A0ABT2UU11_9BACL|nr:VWA domain-containing protein [Paenibacillus sp. WQ 127069]MCU6798105.1 VWA domain-containing protein [Paenibacillus sp. WQ 127069]
MLLQKGQKIDVTKNRNHKTVQVHIRWKTADTHIEVDASAFLLSGSGRCEHDEDFIFYGNPVSSDRSVSYTAGSNAQSGQFTMDWSRLSSSIHKIALTLTIHEGKKLNQYFNQVSNTYLEIIDPSGKETTITFEFGKDLTKETAIVVGEFYLHNREWKFSAIGSGFFGGLDDLCKHYGLEVIDTQDDAGHDAVVAESAAAAAPPVETKINLNKIDLLKKKVEISLAKNKIANEKARVAVVFDASGSMFDLYENGTVQRAFEKVLAIASSMDDDGQLDVWFFADSSMRTGSVTSTDYENYVERSYTLGAAGGSNNEPVVMRDVIKKYSKEEPNNRLPAYVIFFSDGGIYETEAISKILIESSKLGIFWQFVGLGQSYYGVLEELDDLPGRFIDNADFFALDDIDTVSDSELYDRLFNEYPQWLVQARQKRILKS